MKKFIMLCMVLILSLSMVACGNDDNHTNTPKDTETKDPSNNTSLGENLDNQQPQKTILTVDEIKSAVTIVELTVDNWQEYFEITEVEDITPADFEDEEPEIEKDLYVKLKSDNMYGINMVMLFSYQEKLTQNQYDAQTKQQISNSEGIYGDEESTLKAETLSGGSSIGTLGNTGTCTYRKYEHKGKIYETILDVKDIECIKVQGTILIVNIPEDAWNYGMFGENVPYLLYEKDGNEEAILAEGLGYALKSLLGFESQ